MEDRFERAPVGILDVSPPGTVRAVNDAASELLDVAPSEAADAPIRAVFPDSVEATVPRAFNTWPDEKQSARLYEIDDSIQRVVDHLNELE